MLWCFFSGGGGGCQGRARATWLQAAWAEAARTANQISQSFIFTNSWKSTRIGTQNFKQSNCLGTTETNLWTGWQIPGLGLVSGSAFLFQWGILAVGTHCVRQHTLVAVSGTASFLSPQCNFWLLLWRQLSWANVTGNYPSVQHSIYLHGISRLKKDIEFTVAKQSSMYESWSKCSNIRAICTTKIFIFCAKFLIFCD